ncbi:MAG: response regulator [Deltaproteobacteria bacterium]|nr:response regulator [Deltaproteobacteria bacterium]
MSNGNSQVLVVDDDLGPRETLKMILKAHYGVFTASDGEEALQVLGAEPIDLVTLDLKMPGLCGTDLLKEIKRRHPEVQVIIITGHGTMDTAVEGIRQGVCDFIQKPYNLMDLLSAVKRSIQVRESQKMMRSLFEELNEAVRFRDTTYDVLDRVRAHQEVVRKVEGLMHQPTSERRPQENSSETLEFAKVLAHTLESQDPYTHGHSWRVSHYSMLIAEKLGLSDGEKQDLQLASFLHDIGKLGVNLQYIRKPASLSKEEWKTMRQHPVKGADLVAPLNVPEAVRQAIRHHHEFYDGSGYPDGLKAEQIPLPARIVGIADTYDAMATDRPYRKALSREKIIDEFTRFSGIQFDPRLVKIILELISEQGDLQAKLFY